MKNLTNEFHHAQPRYCEIDRIEAKECSSDKYDGVQYAFFAEDYFCIRSIIEVVHEAGLYIESLNFSGLVTGEPYVSMFVVELEDPEYVWI